jgi:hypothetical protein
VTVPDQRAKVARTSRSFERTRTGGEFFSKELVFTEHLIFALPSYSGELYMFGGMNLSGT